MTPEELRQRNAEMVQAARDGFTYSEIAARVGLSLNWTGRIVQANGGPVPAHGKGFKLDVDYRQYRKQYERDATVRELAKEAGVAYSTMYRWLTKAGVTFRGRGTSGRSR